MFYCQKGIFVIKKVCLGVVLLFLYYLLFAVVIFGLHKQKRSEKGLSKRIISLLYFTKRKLFMRTIKIFVIKLIYLIFCYFSKKKHFNET